MGTLTALAVKNAKPITMENGERSPNKLSDGDGLRLDVDKNGNRSWVFRYTSPTTGKERYAGLGSANEVTLVEARDARRSAKADPRRPRPDRASQHQTNRGQGGGFPLGHVQGLWGRIYHRSGSRMEKRQAPPTVAQQPSRLRLSDHRPSCGCRRRHRGSPQSAAPNMGREKRNGSAR
jgi:hypothetical protein